MCHFYCTVRQNTERILQNVIVGVRPASLSKPEVSELRARGVEIRVVELAGSPTELDTALKGVDTVIFATSLKVMDKQMPLADAAKRVGVKRFVPNDWASPCVRGVRKLFDRVRICFTIYGRCHLPARPESCSSGLHQVYRSGVYVN